MAMSCCGITHTMLAVDLFADMLMRADAASYRMCELDEFGQACRDGLILPEERAAPLGGWPS
jgi:hypothetical protein